MTGDTIDTRPAFTVAVTGHRLLPRTVGPRIRCAVHHLVELYPGSTWLTGGAIGADQLVADELLRLGQVVELILPCPMDVQASQWTPDQRDRFFDQVGRVSAVEIMRMDYDAEGYRERNRRLVERADLLLAIWRATAGSARSARPILSAGRRRAG
ncbi:MAG: hypothetical protein HY815_33595 [Candidatus Riflebacteria bacterium]|nr:hypothetical protein [Candidatus Riflebacteria bacterium]